ncbi:hypothetical protein ACTOJ1_000484 [Shigella flexneri]
MIIRYKDKELIEPDFSTLNEKGVLFLMLKDISELYKSDYMYSLHNNFIDIEIEDNILVLLTHQFAFLFNMEGYLISDKFKIGFLFNSNDEPIIFEVKK